jgi:hypothetical protein
LPPVFASVVVDSRAPPNLRSQRLSRRLRIRAAQYAVVAQVVLKFALNLFVGQKFGRLGQP